MYQILDYVVCLWLVSLTYVMYNAIRNYPRISALDKIGGLHELPGRPACFTKQDEEKVLSLTEECDAFSNCPNYRTVSGSHGNILARRQMFEYLKFCHSHDIIPVRSFEGHLFVPGGTFSDRNSLRIHSWYGP